MSIYDASSKEKRPKHAKVHRDSPASILKCIYTAMHSIFLKITPYSSPDPLFPALPSSASSSILLTIKSTSFSSIVLLIPPLLTTQTSIFLAPLSTTSKSACTANRTAFSSLISSS
uniref:Uncharacterized protein n=1 Tax=Ditylum brightwellii TaxID=49249 RepID=A0A7S1ZD65_9STRA